MQSTLYAPGTKRRASIGKLRSAAGPSQRAAVASGVSASCQRLLHRREYVRLRWKIARVLPRYHSAADPHRELTSPALDELGIDPGLFLDERRHTGSARPVVSNPAESNLDALHEITSDRSRAQPPV